MKMFDNLFQLNFRIFLGDDKNIDIRIDLKRRIFCKKNAVFVNRAANKHRCGCHIAVRGVNAKQSQEFSELSKVHINDEFHVV